MFLVNPAFDHRGETWGALMGMGWGVWRVVDFSLAWRGTIASDTPSTHSHGHKFANDSGTLGSMFIIRPLLVAWYLSSVVLQESQRGSLWQIWSFSTIWP